MSDLSRIDRLAIDEFARVMDRIPKQAAPRGPSVNDETDFADDFDRMREVESGKDRRAS